jgi:hypothetical protein
MHVIKFVVVAGIVLAACRAMANEVDYYPATGVLDAVVTTPTTANPGLLGINVYLVDPNVAGSTTLPTVPGSADPYWAFNSFDTSRNHSVQWVSPATTQGQDILAPGTYPLAVLAPNLTSAAFGWTTTYGGTGAYNGNPGGGNNSGAVKFAFQDGSQTLASVVIQQSAVPEPGVLVGLVGVSIMGLASFVVLRSRKAIGR